MRTLLLLVTLLPALAAAQDAATSVPNAPESKKPTRSGEVYKWVDDKGVIHYTDKPPSQHATPAKLPPLQTYRGGTRPDLSKYDKPNPKAPAGAAGAAQVQVVTPSQDETFTGGQRVVPVAVVVTPALTEGQQLIYLLDGVPQATPTLSTSMDFTDVERGTHTVSVSVVDATGQPVGQSSAVTFHVQQAIAGRAEQLQKQTSTHAKPK